MSQARAGFGRCGMKALKTSTAGTLLTRFESSAEKMLSGAVRSRWKRRGGSEEVARTRCFFQAGDDDEESDEQHQQAPIDLAVDASGLTRRVISRSAPAMTATLGTGQPAKKKTIIATETASDFQSSGRFDADARP